LKTLVISEIGNNHNGCIDRAIALIDVVKSAGLQVAKFQMRNLDSLYRNKEVEDLGVEYTKDILQKYNLTFEQHLLISNYCKTVDIEYMCTPWDLASVESLQKLGVKRFKIASADFNNKPLIDKLIETKKHLFFSTGMSTTNEIKKLAEYLNHKSTDFTLLHCNSTYPAPFFDIELNFLKTLKNIHNKVGYSGHERGIAVSVAAVALGASVIERHVTLDKNLEGPDHHASLLPCELNDLSKMIEQVELSLGSDIILERKLSQGAILNKENLGKSIVAANFLPKGKILRHQDIKIVSPGSGLSPDNLDFLINKKILTDVEPDSFILKSHVLKNKNIFSTPNLNLKLNWGVPVRPHDILKFHKIFDAPVYEFHISYNDLVRNKLPNGMNDFHNKTFLVHAPELFANSKLLDLCSPNIETRNESIRNLQSVCDYCIQLQECLEIDQKIKVIANVGGFSTHSFLKSKEKVSMYSQVQESIESLYQPSSEIIPQNMAPFPWHFGGQRYQNIFMVPEEIMRYCTDNNSQICLDTSHLAMYCHFSERNFKDCFDMVLPFASHLHIGDALGLNGEGVELGSSDIDFKKILNSLSSKQTFIVETWQGHKNIGSGFKRELTYLDGIIS
jgi:sialic acid synthase SpsE/endonuclease IV